MLYEIEVVKQVRKLVLVLYKYSMTTCFGKKSVTWTEMGSACVVLSISFQNETRAAIPVKIVYGRSFHFVSE